MAKKEIIPSGIIDDMSVLANEKGELQVIIDGNAIPLKRLDLIKKSQGGWIDIEGSFVLWDDLTAEEKASFSRLWGTQGEARYFKININFTNDIGEEQILEPALKCKVITDTLGQAFLGTVYSFLTAAADL